MTSTSWRKWFAQTYCSIEWLFIPPHSLNFDGLWEAAAKSMQHHLLKVRCNSILNNEEMTSILFQIEHVLNNRPLIAFTNNPNDIFAIIFSIVVNDTRLDAIPQLFHSRLQKIDARELPIKQFRSFQKLFSQFCKRWSSEYVPSLQPRDKWRQEPLS